MSSSSCPRSTHASANHGCYFESPVARSGIQRGKKLGRYLLNSVPRILLYALCGIMARFGKIVLRFRQRRAVVQRISVIVGQK